MHTILNIVAEVHHFVLNNPRGFLQPLHYLLSPPYSSFSHSVPDFGLRSHPRFTAVIVSLPVGTSGILLTLGLRAKVVVASTDASKPLC